ncbi:uncharacterized protein K452DRAFT_362005 [Aplosporella prunicola CBS 121167]|uniref:Amidohydrolase-related domain-containing protein n=1 Tax=Aplosporella prunicola CBS 121167 TaxID=1176127 RepID=A0A6A6B377_9PEZI|nr:uncharacterized protein K452DRAFT_362005 [Aplosporella prunicola CBS 121167]KAF2137191.1 hypothetical protein K452DRAFT_362005 [Aplosporella prunicola CBS 121167]
MAVRNPLQAILPEGSWDCHHHIFERLAAEFPYAPDRHLTPPPATVAKFLEFKQKVGVSNSVLTHGLSYGSDCSSLGAFISRIGKSSTKGIGVIDPDFVSDEELDILKAAGVCGIRVNLYKYKAMDDVELQKVALRAHANRIIGRCPGWSLTITHTHPEFWAELRPLVERELVPAGIPLVTDHFALLKGKSMLPDFCNGDVTAQPGFRDITELLRKGILWVKISAPYRVSEIEPNYADLEPLVRGLVDANPRRIIWGSDWPHTPRMKVRLPGEALKETPYLKVDDVGWLTSLRSWLSEEEWMNMMVYNSRELYGQV